MRCRAAHWGCNAQCCSQLHTILDNGCINPCHWGGCGETCTAVPVGACKAQLAAERDSPSLDAAAGTPSARPLHGLSHRAGEMLLVKDCRSKHEWCGYVTQSALKHGFFGVLSDKHNLQSQDEVLPSFLC